MSSLAPVRSFKPGEDFYRYVNEEWSQSNPLPDDKARNGSFHVLSDQNVDRLHQLLEVDAPVDEPANITLVRSLFHSGMDEERREQAGLDTLTDIIASITKLHTTYDVMNFIASWHSQGFSLIWALGIEPDDKDSRRYTARIHQSGLGLPDRDYYTEPDARFKSVLSAYEAFVAKVLHKLDFSNADKLAGAVIEFETKLARASATAVERRDSEAMYNLYDRPALQHNFPALPWPTYLQTVGLSDLSSLVVSQPTFLVAASQLILTEDLPILKAYLALHCLRPFLGSLTHDWEGLGFDFYGRILQGTLTQEPLYRRVLARTTHLLPEPIGQLYVSHYFKPEAKRAIYNLVTNLRTALAVRIDRLEWMSHTTKQKAHDKLATFMPLLGYPDTWRDYQGLTLTHSYAGNIMAIYRFEWQRDIHRLNKPVDRSEWLMSPATVNAYYWPSTNGITFPAGILQSPFFDASGDVAANYGGIGTVIGHELTHGFDDKGSKFDADGNLNSWWTESDETNFSARTELLAIQYDSYTVEGRAVNGHLTLGENIADLGGVHLAYDALYAQLESEGMLDTTTRVAIDRRFFESYARIWRENIRPEQALQQLISDPHAPHTLRTNGVVVNCDAWYRAFNISPSDPLYRAPEKRVRIW